MTVDSGGRLPRPVQLGSLLLAGSAILGALMTVAAVAAWWHLDAASGAYLQALTDAGTDPDGVPQQIRYSLGYNVAVAAGTALVTALLAVLLRQRLRWAQVTAWCMAAVAWLALGCGLAGGPETAGSAVDLDSTELRRLRHDLLPHWYPSVHTVLALGILAVMTACAILLLREPAQRFYRVARAEENPKWAAAFNRKQADS
jgi:hypothetical protein